MSLPASLKVAAATIAILLGAVLGRWVVLFEEPEFKAELRVDGVEQLDADSVRVLFTLRLTNKLDRDVTVHSADIRVYADAASSVGVTAVAFRDVTIPADRAVESEHDAVLENLDLVSGTVYVVGQVTYTVEGGERVTQPIAETVDLSEVL